jgi:hypothetical protein
MDGGNSQAAGQTQAGGTEARGSAEGSAPDLASLARDWIELWQSELAALAADPETAETWARLAALWAGWAASGLAAWPRGAGNERFAVPPPGHAAAGFPGSAQTPRPSPAPAPPDSGPAPSHRLLERILERLDSIERRLSALEERRGRGAAGGTARRRSRQGKA